MFKIATAYYSSLPFAVFNDVTYSVVVGERGAELFCVTNHKCIGEKYVSQAEIICSTFMFLFQCKCSECETVMYN